jgi:putative peptidoglycan lipid II flippase
MRSAGTVAFLTMLSRVLGLIREQALTYWFGTSEIFSAFRLAFMVPNLTRRLFGEGALSAALIPVLTDTLQEKGEKASRRLVGAVLVKMLTALAALLLIGQLVILVWRFFSNDLALELSAVLLPYMLLVCVVAVLSGVLNVRHKFAAPAAMPVVLNASIILAIVLGGTVFGLEGKPLIYAACFAALAAGAIQLALIWYSLRRAEFSPILTGPGDRGAVSRVIQMMGPMAFGLSVVQFNSLADYLIAYAFIEDSGQRVGPAVLGTAHFLYQLPLGVFGIAIATAVFPALARMAAREDLGGLVATLSRGLRLSMFMALPACVGLMFVAEPLVEALYERGEFGSDSTIRVSGTLFWYSLGMPAYFANQILVRCYYAVKESKVPARIAAKTVVVNLLMNLVLVQFMEERGLALATAVCAGLQTFLLWRSFPIPRDQMPTNMLSGHFRALIATAMMALGLWLLPFVDFFRNLILNSAISALVLMVPTGVAIYGMAAFALRIEEASLVLNRARALRSIGSESS